ncbi:ABC-2 type transport system ATP-binding protein [Natranaerovirga pectinivora]|uniref:ABC-2 type transport system ATP-binding protein n=1 Tax=Natranaerovirga pectinivora TaxID=682400 RepID=A0A4R3MK35_9FIRM|nr:ABC transporter ATP-binding protein [Natranaerovirga pectinivora]TCT14645.1 ABC-2 type transport system ATP-binding protein [Natranaerovirga pectinivora]
MYVIETNNLTKQFKNFTAVNNLDLKIEEGTIYGFLGPNGAGKTTTINMLTGLFKPTSGNIKICGEEVKFGEVKALKSIGFLPDVPEFYPWMNAYDFLKLSGELLGLTGKGLNEKIEALLELVGLKGNKKKIKGYSRGMKQRLGIAQALINEPKIIFLDEPTSALDPIGRREVLDIIYKLRGKVTVFFSTHILTDVERICDKVLILDKGNKIIESTIQELKNTYEANKINITLSTKDEMNTLYQSIKEKDWFVESELVEHKMTITTSDINKAQIEIPKIIYNENLHLQQFVTQEPTLEELFMQVVNTI